MPDYFTTSHAAEVMGCSQRWIQKLIKAGDLPATKFGTDYLIRPADLMQFELIRELNRDTNTHTRGGRRKPRK